MNKVITEYGLSVTIIIDGQPIEVECQFSPVRKIIKIHKAGGIHASRFVESSLRTIKILTEVAHNEVANNIELAETTGGI